MEALKTLLEIVIYSTAVFALLAAVKSIFKKQISPLLHYALWAVFVIRLILPGTLESPVHFFTLEREAPMAEEAAEEAPAYEQAPQSAEKLPAAENFSPQETYRKPNDTKAEKPASSTKPS